MANFQRGERVVYRGKAGAIMATESGTLSDGSRCFVWTGSVLVAFDDGRRMSVLKSELTAEPQPPPGMSPEVYLQLALRCLWHAKLSSEGLARIERMVKKELEL